MKYYIIAGEASGDLHGSNLIKGLKVEDPAAEFRFWGGDLMLAAATGIEGSGDGSPIFGAFSAEKTGASAERPSQTAATIKSPPQKRNSAAGSSAFRPLMRLEPCRSPDASPAMM